MCVSWASGGPCGGLYYFLGRISARCGPSIVFLLNFGVPRKLFKLFTHYSLFPVAKIIRKLLITRLRGCAEDDTKYIILLGGSEFVLLADCISFKPRFDQLLSDCISRKPHYDQFLGDCMSQKPPRLPVAQTLHAFVAHLQVSESFSLIQSHTLRAHLQANVFAIMHSGFACRLQSHSNLASMFKPYAIFWPNSSPPSEAGSSCM